MSRVQLISAVLMLAAFAAAQVCSAQEGSHVKRYGDLSLANKHVDFFLGTSGAQPAPKQTVGGRKIAPVSRSVPQHEADLMYFRNQVSKHPEGSEAQARASRQLEEVVARRAKFDADFRRLREHLKRENVALNEVRKPGSPVVDDWDCYMAAIYSFERHCGKMNEYGLSKARLLANMCNSGLPAAQIERMCSQVCQASAAA